MRPYQLKKHTEIVEWQDKELAFSARDITIIKMNAQGYSNREIGIVTKTHSSEIISRVARRIVRYTKTDIRKPDAILCWFAYAAGLVKL